MEENIAEKKQSEGTASKLNKIVIGKLTVKMIIYAAAAVAVLVFALHFTSNLHTGVRIMDTPTLVQEIKKIAELTSATYVEDVVLSDTIVKYHDKSSLNVYGLFSKESVIKTTRATDKILFVQVATGRIRAGFDLSKVGEGDIAVTDSVLSIVLPPAEILDVIMNPSDIKPFYDEQSGDWTEQEIHEARTQVYNNALEKIKVNAIEHDILSHAEEQGVKKLKALFMSFGFKNVSVTVRKNEAAL